VLPWVSICCPQVHTWTKKKRSLHAFVSESYASLMRKMATRRTIVVMSAICRGDQVLAAFPFAVLEERALFNRRLRYPSLVSRYSTPSACTTRTDSTCQRSDRTLSIEIDEDQHKKQNEVKRAKEKAAVGKCTGCKSQSRVLNISLQISQTSNGIHSLSMSCAAVSPSISNMAFLTTRPSGVLANTARTR
jgi:hypothetical protein